jgi:predicted transposase YdaD
VEQAHATQIYDQTLKSLFAHEIAKILPLLLPGAEFLSESNIEIDRTIVKADLLFWARYKGQVILVNMELQSNRDDTIEQRLLMYHACFHYKYNVPVLSIILYPFKTKVPTPPYREMSGEEILLMFEYQVLILWQMDARTYIERHYVYFYTLLPAMEHANVPLLKQALQEMREYYPDNKEFGHHLTRFNTIMLKSSTLTPEQKEEMKEVLKTVYKYDMFIDENPDVQERIERSRAQAMAEGEVKGRAEGEAKGMQQLILASIKNRFPKLPVQAQPVIEQIQDTQKLEKLFLQLASATTEDEVCKLLNIKKASRRRKQ